MIGSHLELSERWCLDLPQHIVSLVLQVRIVRDVEGTQSGIPWEMGRVLNTKVTETHAWFSLRYSETYAWLSIRSPVDLFRALNNMLIQNVQGSQSERQRDMCNVPIRNTVVDVQRCRYKIQ